MIVVCDTRIQQLVCYRVLEAMGLFAGSFDDGRQMGIRRYFELTPDGLQNYTMYELPDIYIMEEPAFGTQNFGHGSIWMESQADAYKNNHILVPFTDVETWVAYAANRPLSITPKKWSEKAGKQYDLIR